MSCHQTQSNNINNNNNNSKNRHEKNNIYKILRNKNNDKTLKINKTNHNPKIKDKKIEKKHESKKIENATTTFKDIETQLGIKLMASTQENIVLANKICKYGLISFIAALNASLLWLDVALVILYDQEWTSNANKLPFTHFALYSLVNMCCIVLFGDAANKIYAQWCSGAHNWFGCYILT